MHDGRSYPRPHSGYPSADWASLTARYPIEARDERSTVHRLRAIMCNATEPAALHEGTLLNRHRRQAAH